MKFSPVRKVLLTVVGTVLFGGTIGCGKSDGTSAEKAAAGEAEDPVLEHRKLIRTMVWDWEFDRLEKIAAASRKKEIAEGEKYVDLYNFYEWTGPISRRNDDSIWETHLEHLTGWKAAHPDSVTPRIALTKYWLGYAWKARGGGWADSVTPEGWRLFGERLAEAQRELDGVPQELRTDVHYYVEGLTVALGLGLPKGEVQHRFESGLKVDRYYYSLYERLVYYYLPRWYGDPGEVGRVILETAEKMGKDRAFALTRMVWALYAWEKEDVFNGHGIDYPVVKEVYENWTSNEYTDVTTANYYCLYACIAGDGEAAKRMFERIGEQFDSHCWGSEENFRKWKKRYG